MTVKESLHSIIDKIEDEELLHAYLKILEKAVSHSQDPIVGYKPNGDEILQSSMIQEVRAASGRVKAGDFISQEDLEKTAENW